MKEAEFEGKTVEEALLKASAELGFNISDMTYEVLESERGLFGFLGASVRIRVRVPEDETPLAFRKEYVPGHGDTNLAEGLAAADESRARGDFPIIGRQPGTDAAKVNKAIEAVEQLITGMGYQAKVSAKDTPEQILINIQSEHNDVLIGRDGEVLAALQFLANKIVNRFPDDRKLVVLDAEGFKDRRETALGTLAKRMADKALTTKRVVRLSPMNPQDRRLIHMALRDHPGVSTKSDGDGNYRCLLIIPSILEEAGQPGRRGR